jgi:hypothetical protein
MGANDEERGEVSAFLCKVMKIMDDDDTTA